MRGAVALAVLVGACAGPSLPREPAPASMPRPTAAQLAWQRAELGIVFHFDMPTFAEGRYHQPTARRSPVEDLDTFDPDELDTDQWVAAAAAAGARFAILTASHESGFRLWRSDANPCSVGATRWGAGGRDVLAEFHASCERYGIAPGVYVGTRWNAQLGVLDFAVTDRSPLTQDEYNRLIEAEVTEICTRYGDWFEIWFDGGAHGPDQGGPDLLPIVRRHQPDALFYHNLQRADARWGGSESGTVPYPCWATFPFPATGSGSSASELIPANGYALLKTGDPNGRWWMPAMSDAPLRGHGGHEWFWEPDDERLLHPLDKLVDMYCRSVGHNSTLILGATPDDRGLLPDADVARLAALGDAVHDLFAHSCGSVSDPAPGRSVELELAPGSGPVAIVVLQEDIRYGERVRSYRLETRRGGRWSTVARGSCIGHKRIHRLETPVEGDALRVVVEGARATPRLQRVEAFADPSGAAWRWQRRPK